MLSAGNYNMNSTKISDLEYNGLHFLGYPLGQGEYECCVFKNCNFEYADFSGFKFNDCEFIDCNMSMAKLNATAFRDVSFKDSKMLGLAFDSCNDFGLSFKFENCVLSDSIFYKMSLRRTVFKDCILQETDFAEADLRNAAFLNCDLSGAVFDRTNLEQTDFRTAYGFAFNPENNKLRGAKFSPANLAGLLLHHKIVIDKNP